MLSQKKMKVVCHLELSSVCGGKKAKKKTIQNNFVETNINEGLFRKKNAKSEKHCVTYMIPLTRD